MTRETVFEGRKEIKPSSICVLLPIRLSTPSAMCATTSGDNASSLTYVIIALALIAIIVAVIMSRRNKKRRHKKSRK